MEEELRRSLSGTARGNSRSGAGKAVLGRFITILLCGAMIFMVFNAFGTRKKMLERQTVANLLETALMPVGSTMYIWGGGWDDADTGANGAARSIGLSPQWENFAKKQTEEYDHNLYLYEREKGLDCSGYIGWVVYNIMEHKNNKDGYVIKSTKMAEDYAARGWGDYTKAGEVTNWKAGDIMSKEGHVWMVVGQCEDGSVVLLHSTPPGVSLAGTLLEDGTKSQAVQLAEEYMSRFYPEWYSKYDGYGKDYSYLTDSSRMRWNRDTLADVEGLTGKSAQEVLEYLFQ